jgi:hypothetical protein
LPRGRKVQEALPKAHQRSSNRASRVLGFLLFACLNVARGSPSVAAQVDGVIPPSGGFNEAYVCVSAIAAAERRYGLPKGLLRAIGDVESGRLTPDGREIEPWPWTINVGGHGTYFDSLSQAAVWVQREQSTGVRSIDVGCMQINLLQHPKAFRSLAEAFDPITNVDYAARFVLSLFNATGDWATAVGSYHSETKALAEPYRTRVLATFHSDATAPCLSRATALQMAWHATLPHDGTNVLAYSGQPVARSVAFGSVRRPVRSCE